MDNGRVGPFHVEEIEQKGGTFFSASIPAEQLVMITHSDVRRLVDEERDVERYLGVQRPLNTGRVKKIREYILSPDPTFPTAIIVAVDERCVDYDPETRKMTLLEVLPSDPYLEDEMSLGVPINRIARVLDGQHRLAGFFNDDGEFDINTDRFDLNVSIFVGADISVQAQIFATVNLAQTKVSKSLVYELEDLSTVRSPFKTAHNVAVALDGFKDSPFFKRIKRLGVVTPGRTGETISQAAFVEALTDLISRDPFADRNNLLDGKKLGEVYGPEFERTPFRNLFIAERDLDIADNVNNYFSAVRDKWPQAWEDTGRKSGILPKTNAFRAFMRRLRDVYPPLVQHTENCVVPISAYAATLADIDLGDEVLTSGTFKPGSSGQSAFYKVLSGERPPQELFDFGTERSSTP